MAWVEVPAEHHPIFIDALPRDPRIERIKMFGGIAAKVNGNFFSGLFGRSAIVQLPEPARAEALALEGAGPFDPMGDGRMRSDKVMLPESIMGDEEELRAWLSRAFQLALALPPKAEKPAKARKMSRPHAAPAAKKPAAKKPAQKKPAPKKLSAKAAKRVAPTKQRVAARTASKRRGRR